MQTISKELEKQIYKEIKLCGKKYGFKTNGITLFKLLGSDFVHINFFIISPNELIVDIYVKKYSYDELFWKVLDMSENMEQPMSLRAIGAFKAPSVNVVPRKVYLLNEDLENLPNTIVEEIEDICNKFLKENDVNEYILKQKGILDEGILKILAYCDMEKYDLAIQTAESEVKSGNDGRFENQGKRFCSSFLELYKQNNDKVSQEYITEKVNKQCENNEVKIVDEDEKITDVCMIKPVDLEFNDNSEAILTGKKAKKRFVLGIIILLFILLFPICDVYEDGGTQTFTSLMYKVIVWNQIEGKTGTEVYFFPNNFYDYEYYEER